MSKQREQGSAERYYQCGRFLTYGGIKLVPVASYPHDYGFYADKWHIHGRRILSTAILISMAAKRSISVTITEYDGLTTQTTRLN